MCEYLKDRGSAVSTFDQIHPIYSAIVPLKILIMKEKEPENYALLANFMDHQDQRHAFPDYWKAVKTHVVDFIMGLEKQVKTTESEILNMVGIVDTNAHEISNRNGIGFRGVFPVVSLMSHQCIVNTRQIMSKEMPFSNTCRYLIIELVTIFSRLNLPKHCRATVLIPKGQEILTTYIWPWKTTWSRRQNLRDGWHFSCSCPRCADPSELGALTSAILCESCPQSSAAAGFLLQENPLEMEEDKAQWKCQQCGHFRPTIEIQSLIQDLSNQVESLDRNDLTANLEALQTCRKSLHANHALCTELRTRIIPIISRQPGLTMDQIRDDKLRLKRVLASENLRVFDVISPGLSRHRGGLLFELQESEFFVAKRQLERGEMSEVQFAEKLKMCKKFLMECGKCLHNERSNSLEQFYEKSANVSLKAVLDFLHILSPSG